MQLLEPSDVVATPPIISLLAHSSISLDRDTFPYRRPCKPQPRISQIRRDDRDKISYLCFTYRATACLSTSYTMESSMVHVDLPEKILNLPRRDPRCNVHFSRFSPSRKKTKGEACQKTIVSNAGQKQHCDHSTTMPAAGCFPDSAPRDTDYLVMFTAILSERSCVTMPYARHPEAEWSVLERGHPRRRPRGAVRGKTRRFQGKLFERGERRRGWRERGVATVSAAAATTGDCRPRFLLSTVSHCGDE